jgi:hypothetical protein
MAGAFPDIEPPPRPPSNYQEFWNTLRRDPRRYEFYRAHQGQVLEDYSQVPDSKKDVAICLPTGTGKTVIALSIGRFAQLQTKERVLFLCPTKQLVSQVLDEAKGLGIPAVNLTGSWDDVAPPSKDAYRGCQAIGVATYHTLFNSRPRVDDPDLLILDDVHAAGQTVASPWLVEVRKDDWPELFEELKTVISRRVSGAQAAVFDVPSPPTRETNLVHGRDWLAIKNSVREVVDRLRPDHQSFLPWPAIRARLDGCFCFYSNRRIVIRAWIPPAFELTGFASASRRVYLSATLDLWGQLEQTVGVSDVVRLTAPEIQVPGRRLMLNLDRLLPNRSELERIQTHVSLSPKTLILCRKDEERDAVIEALNAGGYAGQMLGAGDFERELEQFSAAERAVFVVSNRYDGMDLGHGVCQNIIVWNLPIAIGLQEEFLSDQWKLTAAAEARARHRVHQGVGRCTRQEADVAVVGFVGDKLTSFLLQPRVRDAMPRRLRAELVLFDNIQNPANYESVVRGCLGRTEDWGQVCGRMDRIAADSPPEIQPSEATAKVHRRFARFSELLWVRDFPAAVECSRASAQELVSLHEEDSAAAWFYLAAVGEDLTQFAATGTTTSDRGSASLLDASRRAGGRVWFGELSLDLDFQEVEGALLPQVDGVLAFLRRYPAQSDGLRRKLESALADLAQTSANQYHRGMREFGAALGLVGTSPSRPAAPDVIWSLGDRAVEIFQAKVGKEPESPLSVREVWQVIETKTGVEANEKLLVDSSKPVVCVTESTRIASEIAHARPDFAVARPGQILRIAGDWFEKLKTLHPQSTGNELQAKLAIQTALSRSGLRLQEIGGTLRVTPATEALGVVE